MSPSFKSSVQKLAGEIVPGPAPSFAVINLVSAMESVTEGRLGRVNLAARLDLGEGAARTIAKRLKDAGLINVTRAGCILTEKGRKLWQRYSDKVQMVKIDPNELAFSDYCVAVKVKHAAGKVKTGIEQRDAAVAVGADGATTILIENGKPMFPSSTETLDKNYPKTAKKLLSCMKLDHGDVVVVISARSLKAAHSAAIAAAWTLLE